MQSGPSSPVHSSGSSVHSPQQSVSPPPPQNQFGMANPNALAYQMPQMTPMMQMQMQMQMGMNPQFQAQAMHQSVMRHPSPGPIPLNAQGFMGPQF